MKWSAKRKWFVWFWTDPTKCSGNYNKKVCYMAESRREAFTIAKQDHPTWAIMEVFEY